MTTIGVQYHLKPEECHGAVFEPTCQGQMLLKGLKSHIESKYDAEVFTWDEVDYSTPDTIALYVDYSWRDLGHDSILKTIPKGKRVLILLEPSIVNPSMYLIPWLCNRFSRVITWDERLLRTKGDFRRTVVNPFEEPPDYKENKFSHIGFSDKKMLCAVSMNRSNNKPWSTYRLRKEAYRYFDHELPDGFDLFGKGWGTEGFCNAYKGELPHMRGCKVAKMAHYRFALCYENTAKQPGYVSEKISDCICARCVPIYYGSEGIEERVPPECFVNAKRFMSLDEMKDFMLSMTESEHQKYIDAMGDFCKSDLARKFTREYFFDTIAKALDLTPRRCPVAS